MAEVDLCPNCKTPMKDLLVIYPKGGEPKLRQCPKCGLVEIVK